MLLRFNRAALFWSVLVTGALVAAIVVGSRRLQYFDAALVPYTFASIFTLFGLTYHYATWLQRPPTRRYWQRTWEQIRQGNVPLRLGLVLRRLVTHILAQSFIWHRSRLRWWMHFTLFWGCVLAALVTFPLVFGWIHFATVPGHPYVYQIHLFGFPAGTFAPHSLLGWVVIHMLDFAAVLVLVGVGLSFWRRTRDPDALAVQNFYNDLLPLLILFAVSVTGLMLTFSSLWLRGYYYSFLAQIHAITVIGGLLYLPFGKFFHIVQRPAQLGVALYKKVGAEGESARCACCQAAFTSQMHLDDLKQVLAELDFHYEMPPGSAIDHYQNVCPRCRRVTMALTQARISGREFL
ncbi:MAG: MFS transporter [Armatimonadetes bacterium]|nr:MFS transporter [Armatimonadota bacterium]